MKRTELKQIIKEEIIKVLNEVSPQYKSGDTFPYRGAIMTVITDDGYVVRAKNKEGIEKTLNHKQIKDQALPKKTR